MASRPRCFDGTRPACLAHSSVATLPPSSVSTSSRSPRLPGPGLACFERRRRATTAASTAGAQSSLPPKSPASLAPQSSLLEPPPLVRGRAQQGRLLLGWRGLLCLSALGLLCLCALHAAPRGARVLASHTACALRAAPLSSPRKWSFAARPSSPTCARGVGSGVDCPTGSELGSKSSEIQASTGRSQPTLSRWCAAGILAAAAAKKLSTPCQNKLDKLHKLDMLHMLHQSTLRPTVVLA